MSGKPFFSRKEPRISLELPAEYQIPNDNTLHKGTLMSLSIETLDLETNQVIHPGGRLTIRIFLPAESPIDLEAEILRCFPDKLGKGWRLGLRILKMDEEHKDILTHYIESQGYYGWYYR